MTTAIFTLLGTIVGVILGWVLASKRSSLSPGALERELREQLSAQQKRESEHTVRDRQVQEQLMQQNAAAARSKSDAEAAERRLQEQEKLFRQQLLEAKEAQQKSMADLREAFTALSADALKQNNPEFLRLAQENFGKLQEVAKGDLEKRQESIAGMLKPLEEQLKIYQERLAQSESKQAGAIGEVRTQLESLGLQSQNLANETIRFRMVLSSSQARGRWGEETLRRVVEAAGMSPHCDFTEQEQQQEGKPDMVVRLPGNRTIIIDSKAPDFDVVERLRAATEQERTGILQEHASKLRGTIKALAARNYPSQDANAHDCVVMFLPAESVFSLALEADPELIQWSTQQHIMLATPATLIALLRSVSISWLQHDQTQNSRRIADEASELFKRVSVFIEHFAKIRRGLEGANEAFNAAVGSYQSSVRPSGERMLELGVNDQGKELPQIEPVQPVLRALASDA